MLKAVFFDLDGTLLPMDEEMFIKLYFKLLCVRLAPTGYDSEELVGVIYKGITAMFKNDGSKTNEEAFWEVFKNHYGEDKMCDKEYIDEFYVNEFKDVKKACGENSLAKEIVKFCNDNNLIVGLSTNPLFPKAGTLTRMSFVGLEESDFDFVTTYEDCYYSKPNPMYFKALLDKYNLKSDEVILFGNNTLEDGDCASLLGIKVYMVGDCIINKGVNKYEHIKMDEVIGVIKSYL